MTTCDHVLDCQLIEGQAPYVFTYEYISLKKLAEALNRSIETSGTILYHCAVGDHLTIRLGTVNRLRTLIDVLADSTLRMKLFFHIFRCSSLGTLDTGSGRKMDGKSRRYAMVPAYGIVFLHQNPRIIWNFMQSTLIF